LKEELRYELSTRWEPLREFSATQDRQNRMNRLFRREFGETFGMELSNSDQRRELQFVEEYAREGKTPRREPRLQTALHFANGYLAGRDGC